MCFKRRLLIVVFFFFFNLGGFPEPSVRAGVVDSEDIPLNLSRELLQESILIRYRPANLFFKKNLIHSLFHSFTVVETSPPGSFVTFCSRG